MAKTTNCGEPTLLFAPALLQCPGSGATCLTRFPAGVKSLVTLGLLPRQARLLPHSQRVHSTCVWCGDRAGGRGTATFRHALPGATLRGKRSGRTTSSMFSASHVDSQRGASEGLVWGEKLSLSLSLSLPPSPRARDYAAWPTSRTARQWLRARDYAARPTSRTARQWWPGGAMRSTTLHEIRPRQWWPGGAMRSTPLHEIRPLIQKLFIHQEVEVVGCSAKQLRRKSRRLSGRVRR